MKFTGVNSSKLAVTGMVIVIGLTVALAIVGYYIYNTETKRVDDRPAVSSKPIEPEPAPISPEDDASSSSVEPNADTPVNTP